MRTCLSIIVICALVLADQSTAQQVEMSWNIDPKTQTYVHEQTKIAFRRSVAAFRLVDAKAAQLNGAATFTYRGTHGSMTVFFVPRAAAGCAAGQDCVSPAVAAHSGYVRSLHGKHDLQQSSSLRGAGRARGRRQMYRFVASPQLGGRPAYAEAGALEIGNFVYAYHGTFSDKAGLDDLSAFLRAFGVTKAR